MVYFTLGMWIFKSLPYERILAEILRDAPGLAPPLAGEERASAAAIGRARRRLGVEPLRLLFDQAAGPAPAAPQNWHGLRPVRLSHVAVGVPATPANLQGFAGAGHRRAGAAGSARPSRSPLRAQLSLLMEDGTGRIVAADVGEAKEPPLERLLDGALPAEMLLIMDERPLGARLWAAAERLGVEQLWPLDEQPQPSHATRLPDGSLLSKLPADDGSELVARIVPRPGGPVRLATSILDHRAAPAAELLALYDARRAAGAGLDGVGSTYGSGGRLELRSKDPEMVRQELYAMLCVQHAIGDLVGPAR
jgi:hypothetical protein